MSSYILTDEIAIDVLIFWVQSTDGSISFAEEDAVKRVLNNMDYDLTTYRKTLSQIAAMSTIHIEQMVEEAITYVRSNLSDDGKKLTFHLLDTIARCEGLISPEQEERVNRLKKELGL